MLVQGDGTVDNPCRMPRRRNTMSTVRHALSEIDRLKEVTMANVGVDAHGLMLMAAI